MEFSHELIFTPQYPPSLKIPLTKPKKHLRPDGVIVPEIILNSERFSNPPKRYGREYTTTGTKIIYPGTVNIRRPKVERSKSFLADWIESCASQGSGGSQAVSPYIEDDMPVFDDDFITSDQRRTLRRINTISAHQHELPNVPFLKCVELSPWQKEITNNDTKVLRSDSSPEPEYAEILNPLSFPPRLESSPDNEYMEIIEFIERKENDLQNRNSSGNQNAAVNKPEHIYANVIRKNKSTSAEQKKSKVDEPCQMDVANKAPAGDASDTSSSSSLYDDIDLESSMSTFRKIHQKIDELTEDLINASPKKKQVDMNELFISAERCAYDGACGDYAMRTKLDNEDVLAIEACKTLPQTSKQVINESSKERKRSKSSLGPKDKFQKTSDLHIDLPKLTDPLSSEQTFPSQTTSLSVDNLILGESSTEVSNARILQNVSLVSMHI